MKILIKLLNMASLNRVTLIGRLGKDPEIRTFSEGVKKASFSIATSEKYRDKNGELKEETQWHNIVAFRMLADRSESYLKKGMQVYIEGKLTSRSYTDKDGVEKRITEIVANNLMILEKRDTSETTEQHTIKEEPPLPEYNDLVADDLPF